jgi:serine/threonine protein kinase
MDRRQDPPTVSSSSQSLAAFLSTTQPTHLEAATIAANLARHLMSVHSGGEAFLCLSLDTVIVEEGLNVHLRSLAAEAEAAEGDLAYRAPEQLDGGNGDWRSDCWSVGAIFYQLYTGQAPFRGVTRQALEASILSDEPTELPVLAGDLAAEVHRILRRCLAKAPAERYAGIADLVAELNGLCRRLVSRSAVGGGVPTVAESPKATPAQDAPLPTESFRTALAERRAEWARGKPPSWWSLAALPVATVFVIVALLLYCGRKPEIGSEEAGGNAGSPVERLQDLRSVETPVEGGVSAVPSTTKEFPSPNIEEA